MAEALEWTDYLFPRSKHIAVPNIVLMAIYGYILSKGSAWIADGAELLTNVLPGALVGGLILPVLGAVPDAAIVIASCVGSSDSEEVQRQVMVGVGTLAGSTVMLLTIPILGTMWLARCNIGAGGIAIDGQSFVKTGATVTKDVPIVALIALGTSVSYLIIQIPAFIWNDANKERWFALAGFICCAAFLATYSIFLMNFHRFPQRILSTFRKKLAQLNEIERARAILRESMTSHQSPSYVTKPIVVNGLVMSLLDNMDQDEYTPPVLPEPKLVKLVPVPPPSSRRSVLTPERLRHMGLMWLMKAHERKIKRDFGMEQEEEKEVQLAGKEKLKVWSQAIFWLALGTITVALFSDPMVNAIDDLSNIISPGSDVLSFYISFIITPIASNASELISALIFAKKKQNKITSVGFAALFGAATMNNTLCLGIFLLLIYLKRLSWKFGGQVVAILLAEVVACLMCVRRTHRLWEGFVIVLLYPAALLIVAVWKLVSPP